MSAAGRDRLAALVFGATIVLIVGLGFLGAARGDHQAAARQRRRYDVADVRRAFASEGVRLERLGGPFAAPGQVAVSTPTGDVEVTVSLRRAKSYVILTVGDQRVISRRNIVVVYTPGDGRERRVERALSLLARAGGIPDAMRAGHNLTAPGTAIFMTRGGEGSNWSLPLHGFVRDVRGRKLAELGIHAFGTPLRLRAGRYRLAIEDGCSGEFRVLPRQRVWVVVRLLKRSCLVRISFHR